MTRCTSIVTLSAVIAVVGCNTRTPIFDNAVTSPTSLTAPASFPPASVSAIQVLPPTIVAGRDGRGILSLDFPADGNTTLTLSASSPGVDITPRLVTMPKGSLSVSFNVGTRATAGDTDVDITASFNGSARSTRVAVWALLPNFFSYASDPEAQLPGGGTRLTSNNARIEAYCNRSVVIGVADGGTPSSNWVFHFGAPDGRPLRPGVYENAGADLRGNTMTVRPRNQSCRPIGRFTVHEANFDFFGDVKSLWVTYEQSCQGQTGVIRGDLRLTNARRSADSPFTNCLLQ